MYRIDKTLPWAAASCVLALTMACSSGPASPSAPAAVTPGDNAANADGSTLKVTPPTPVSPIGDLRLTTRQPVMTVTNSTGRFAGAAFTYDFQLMNDSGGVVSSTNLSAGPGTTTWAYPTELDRDTPYRWQARARMGNAVGPWSSPSRFLTVKENRTPNSPTGRLPLPNASGIVAQVIAQNPGITSNARSCQDPSHGGNAVTGWELLDKVVDTLRLTDTRWGYNGKRGNPNDPSADIVAYNWGNQPDEGTTNVYIIDILLNHCGSGGAFPTWIDQTQVTLNSGTIGRWISRGRFPSSQGIQ